MNPSNVIAYEFDFLGSQNMDLSIFENSSSTVTYQYYFLNSDFQLRPPN